MPKYKMSKAIQLLSNKLDSHIGSGDRAHLPVDRQHSGFMTPTMYLGLVNAIGNRTQLKTGTDVFALVPGHYTGFGLLNSSLGPDDKQTLMIDVYQYREYYKQIFEIVSSSGKIYAYTMHTNADGSINTYAPSGWTHIERYTTLWEGSLSDTTSKAKFSDIADKYSTLKITTYNPANATTKTTTVKNQQELNITDYYITSTQDGLVMMDMRLFVVGSYAQIQYSHGTNIKGSGITPYNGSCQSLVKIEGIM